VTAGDTYIIPFKGLSAGIHEFRWTLDDRFFGRFPESEILGGSLDVLVTLNKKSRFLELDFRLEGTLKVPCDRCLDPVAVPSSLQSVLIVRFGDTTHEETDELLILAYEEHELDVAQYIYEYAHLSLPFRKVHGTDQAGQSLCNPEMMKKLEQYLVERIPEDTEDENDEMEFVNN
jgi:uncharacterized metal-binding protein YceD (DUF177 family)